MKIVRPVPIVDASTNAPSKKTDADSPLFRTLVLSPIKRQPPAKLGSYATIPTDHHFPTSRRTRSSSRLLACALPIMFSNSVDMLVFSLTALGHHIHHFRLGKQAGQFFGHYRSVAVLGNVIGGWLAFLVADKTAGHRPNGLRYWSRSGTPACSTTITSTRALVASSRNPSCCLTAVKRLGKTSSVVPFTPATAGF